MTEQHITEETINMNWIDEELSENNNGLNGDFERLPSFRFDEENKVYTLIVFTGNKFKTWTDTQNNINKAIIPVLHNQENKNLWLNKKNPLYGELLKYIKVNQKIGTCEVKIMKIGNLKNTKYVLIK